MSIALDSVPLRLWVIDSQASARDLRSVAALLRELRVGSAARVQPVAILSPSHLKVGAETFREFAADLEAGAAERVQETMRELGEIPGALPPQVLVNRGTSRRDDARRVVIFADETRAHDVVVSVPGRDGWCSWGHGFHDHLLGQIARPVFSVTPACETVRPVQRILFPTTFDEDFLACFDTTVTLARKFGARLSLYHKENQMHGRRTSRDMSDWVSGHQKKRARVLERWQERASAEGVHVSMRWDREPGLFLPSLLTEVKDGRHDLVVVVTQSSPVCMAGTVAREVVSRATCPVLVLKSEACQ